MLISFPEREAVVLAIRIMNLQRHAGSISHAVLPSPFGAIGADVQVCVMARETSCVESSVPSADYYIFCDDLAVPDRFSELPSISVYQTHYSFLHVKSVLDDIQRNAAWQHACLVSVNNSGVLLTGRPGSGKSLLALEMLCAGHQLVADDMVYVCREGARLWGICPLNLSGWLHVRGKGFIDVNRCFGAAALLACEEIKVHIHLSDTNSDESAELLQIQENVLFSSTERMVLSFKKEENTRQRVCDIAQLSLAINKIRKETVN